MDRSATIAHAHDDHFEDEEFDYDMVPAAEGGMRFDLCEHGHARFTFLDAAGEPFAYCEIGPDAVRAMGREIQLTLAHAAVTEAGDLETQLVEGHG